MARGKGCLEVKEEERAGERQTVGPTRKLLLAWSREGEVEEGRMVAVETVRMREMRAARRRWAERLENKEDGGEEEAEEEEARRLRSSM